MADEQIVQLLSALREGQKEQLALYREVTQRSLEAQKTAIAMQRRAMNFYRSVVAVAAILVAGLLAYLISHLP